MSSEHAKPGDTIEILWDNEDWSGKRFLVINRPSDVVDKEEPGDAWFLNDGGEPTFFRIKHYKVVKSPKGSLDVDAKLKSQLYDNLNSVFG